MEGNLTKTDGREPLFFDRVVRTPEEMYAPGILLDAAKSTRDLFPGVDGEAIMNDVRMQRLLGSPEVTQPDAPYQDRIQVMWRMLEMVNDEWRSDVVYGGLSNDGTHGSILYRGGVGWELLVDMLEPNNALAFRADHSGLWRKEELSNLIERHKKGEDIFGESGLEFLLPIYKDWKLPIIGVKKLIGFRGDKKHIFTRGDIKTEDSALNGFSVGDNVNVFGFDAQGRVLDYSAVENQVYLDCKTIEA